MISKTKWDAEKSKIISILERLDRLFDPVTSAGVAWHDVNTGTSSGWHDIAYSESLGLLVAVSAFGPEKVMTSDDFGENWVIRSAPDQDWRNVCWAEGLGLFVAVAKSGSSGRVMTSPDGINWTLRNSPLNDFHGVCWSQELGLLVAVAQSGSGDRVMTSPDGINWTSRNSTSDNVWQTVTWVDELGLFVSVAEVGSGGRCMTSPDGINWTERLCPVQSWKFVAWNKRLQKLVAVSYDGNVMTSPDGVDWMLGECPSNAWHHVCYGGGVCVAMGENAGPQVMRSEDLETWGEMPATSSSWQACAWVESAERFVAIGLYGVCMYSDKDPVTGGGDVTPGEFTYGSTVSVSGPGIAWLNPTNVLNDDGHTSCPMVGQGNTYSQTLTVSGFGFEYHGAKSVEISIEKFEDPGSNPPSAQDLEVSINGVDKKKNGIWGESARVDTYSFDNVPDNFSVKIGVSRQNGTSAVIKSVKARTTS